MSRALRFHYQLVGLLYTVASALVGVLWALVSIVGLLFESLAYALENIERILRVKFEAVHARVHAAPAAVRE